MYILIRLFSKISSTLGEKFNIVVYPRQPPVAVECPEKGHESRMYVFGGFGTRYQQKCGTHACGEGYREFLNDVWVSKKNCTSEQRKKDPEECAGVSSTFFFSSFSSSFFLSPCIFFFFLNLNWTFSVFPVRRRQALLRRGVEFGDCRRSLEGTRLVRNCR
jgi:hypothetical protein